VSGFFARCKRSAAVSTPSAPRSELARVSLFALVMTCAVGCLDSPPQYSEPTRIPPQIVTSGLIPATTSLYVTDSQDIPFTIPFRADDAGQRLVSRFVLDLGIGTGVLQDEVPIPGDDLGRPFELQTDPPRSFQWKWQWTEYTSSGCHTITAIMSEQSNFNGAFTTQEPLKEARVTWFLWIRDPMATDSQPVICLQNTKNTSASQ
jgi:hypothetical protein